MMRKPIPTSVHGVLDYMTAGLLVALPRVMGWSRDVTRLLDASAAATVGYSLLTKYELGPVKVLPMKAHLALDAASGAGLIGAAMVMDDEDADVRLTLAGLGVFEIGASLLSQTRPAPRTTASSAPQTRGVAQPMFGGRGREPSMPAAPVDESSSARGVAGTATT